MCKVQKRRIVKILTVSRLLAAILLVAAGTLHWWGVMFSVLLLGFATDMADGDLARYWNVTSESGRRLDANATAALTGGALLGTVFAGLLAWWAPFAVLALCVVARWMARHLSGDLQRLVVLVPPVVNLVIVASLEVALLHRATGTSYSMLVVGTFIAMVFLAYIKHERIKHYVQDTLR